MEALRHVINGVAAVLLAAAVLFDGTGAGAMSLTVMFERDENAGSGDELAFNTYATLNDVLTGNQSSSTFSTIDVNGPFSTTGLTWDGSQFVVMFERDENAGSGDELAFNTYATFNDLLTGNQSSSTFSTIDVNGPFTTTGIDARFSESSIVPEPATVVLMGLGLVGLGYAGRRKLVR